jgi:hypothetical protein
MEMKINGRWIFEAGAAGFTTTPKSRLKNSIKLPEEK